MPAAPEEFLNRPLLRHLAGDERYASGEQCYALGKVRQVRSRKDRVSANVADARTYRVKLWRRRGELLFCCDCEAGREETFCKHCVAVGLAWLSRVGHEATPGSPSAEATETDEIKKNRRQTECRQIDAHLATVDKHRLVNLLLEATDFDEILRRRLLLEALGISRAGDPSERRGAAGRANPDFDAYRRLLREAIVPNGFVDYHAMPDYAQGLEEAIRPLAGLLRDGWSEPVIELSEFVLWELDAASDRVDTGDALLNKAYDELQRCHYEACRAAPPAPRALASRLLEFELEGGLGVFNNAARTYANILGPEGLEAWRTLLVREWTEQAQTRGTPLEPGQQPLLIDHRRFQTQLLMERLASSENDAEAVLSIKCADLAGVHDFVALAEWLQERGRRDEAIACVTRALLRFTSVQDRMVLNDFLISLYQHAGRFGDAIPLAWQQFCASIDLERFTELKSVVTGLDREQWPVWRDRALAEARARALESRADHSCPVMFLLAENLAGPAWKAADEGGCSDDLWLRLASLRVPSNPRDALQIYQRKITALLTTNHQSNYREALELVGRVRAIYNCLHAGAEFTEYLATLHVTYRHKRAFLRRLHDGEA